jgi:hypothetical protein
LSTFVISEPIPKVSGAGTSIMEPIQKKTTAIMKVSRIVFFMAIPPPVSG